MCFTRSNALRTRDTIPASTAMGASCSKRCSDLPCLPLCSSQFARTYVFCCCPCLFDQDGEPNLCACCCDGWSADEIKAMSGAVRRIQRPVF